MTDASFHGIDIKSLAGLPDDLLFIMGPSQVAAIDTSKGASVVLPYEDVHAGFARHLAATKRFEGPKVRPLDGTTPGIEPRYSVAQHVANVSNLCAEIDMTSDNFHDILEREEARLRRRIAAKQEQFMRDAITGTTGEPPKPFSLDEMEEQIEQAFKVKREQDKRLIEALLAAGVDVMQGQHEGRPKVILPADMNAARKEVLDERDNRDAPENFYRDTLGYWGGRLDMRP